MITKKLSLFALFLFTILLLNVSLFSALNCQVMYKNDFGRKLTKVNGNSNVISCCIDPAYNLTDSCDCFGEEVSSCGSAIDSVINNGSCDMILDFAGCGEFGNTGCGVSNISNSRSAECKRNDAGTNNIDELVVSPVQELWNMTSNSSMGVHRFVENGTTVVQEDCGYAIEVTGLGGAVYVEKNNSASYCDEVNVTARKESIDAGSYEVKLVQIFWDNGRARRLENVNEHSEIAVCCMEETYNPTNDCDCTNEFPSINNCNDLENALNNLGYGGDIKILDHSGCNQGNFGCSQGSCNNAYSISNCNQLQNITNDLSGTYTIASDIDCSSSSTWNSGKGFKPIGNNSYSFTGEIIGNGKTISGLYINRTTEDNVGLFGEIYTNSKIYNLKLRDITIYGNDKVGGLFGFSNNSNYHYVPVEQVSIDGDITGNNNIGGLGGYSTTNVSKSKTLGSVTGKNYTGGLIGSSNANIMDSYSHSVVTGDYLVGSLLGYNNGLVHRTYGVGLITGQGNKGGLVGSSGVSASCGNNFYDKQTTTLTTSACGSGKTTLEMQSASTYSSWDLASVWSVNSYPCLIWEEDCVPLNFNSEIYLSEEEDTTGTYTTMRGVSAGLSIFILYIARSLPLLMIGLMFVAILVVIGFAIAGVIKKGITFG